MTTRIVVVAGGAVGAARAGPGVRALGIARALAAEFAVTLLVPDDAAALADIETGPLRIRTMTPPVVRTEWRAADAVVTHGFDVPLSHVLFGRGLVIADLYLPLHVELLNRPTSRDRWYQLRAARRRIGAVLERTDLLVVANDRQRAHYLDFLRELRPQATPPPVVVVPTGIARDAPAGAPVGGAPRGSRPLFLWNGGIYPWLDAESALDAWRRLVAAGSQAVLEFLGTVPPSEGPELHEHAAAIVRRAAALGLLDSSVVVHEGWRTPAESEAALARARAVVSLHRDGPEAHVAHRTRLVAAIAAEVPILCTRGDAIADLITARGLGITVAPEHPDEVVAAVRRLAEDDEFHDRCRTNLAAVRRELTWDVVTQPLVATLRTLTPAHRLGRARALALWTKLETLRLLDSLRARGPALTLSRAWSRTRGLG